MATTAGKARQLQNTAMQLRKVCNHPYLFLQDDFYNPVARDEILRASGKFELLDRILPKLHRSGHRVLLFSQMVKCMDIISDYLEWKEYDYLRLDGSTNTEARGELLEKWNEPNSPHFLFMLSTRAGGMGLNLQTADTVIIFDSDWNPQMDAQAEDRAHRIGQTRRVKVLVLVCDGTIEEDILRRAGEKKAIDHKAIQAGMFNQASTAEERNAVLKDILQRGEDGVGMDVPTHAEVNVMIARSEEEIEMFDEMDREVGVAWELEWGSERARLMEDHELPTEVRWTGEHNGGGDGGEDDGGTRGKKKSKKQEDEENMVSSEDDGEGGKRRRKRRAAAQAVHYDDGLSEDAFLRILEDGGDKRDLVAASQKVHARREKREEKRGREQVNSDWEESEEEPDFRPAKMQKVGSPGGGGRGRGRGGGRGGGRGRGRPPGSGGGGRRGRGGGRAQKPGAVAADETPQLAGTAAGNDDIEMVATVEKAAEEAETGEVGEEVAEEAEAAEAREEAAEQEQRQRQEQEQEEGEDMEVTWESLGVETLSTPGCASSVDAKTDRSAPALAPRAGMMVEAAEAAGEAAEAAEAAEEAAEAAGEAGEAAGEEAGEAKQAVEVVKEHEEETKQ